MPNHGDRVHVRPRGGLQVQRGDGLYGQCLPPEGMECTWDEYLGRRHDEGAIEIVQQAAQVPEAAPVIPSIPSLPTRGRRSSEEPA